MLASENPDTLEIAFELDVTETNITYPLLELGKELAVQLQ